MLSFFKKSPNLQEQGYAAFTVTLIIMVVLSLIVLGFAQNSRREQQNALYNQLDVAAYYAAESGVNDAYSVIKADYQKGVLPPAQTNNCTVDNQDQNNYINGAQNTNVLRPGNTGQVAYTCLIVNPQPPTLVYSPLNKGHGQVVPIFGRSGGANVPISSVTISWQEHNMPNGDSFITCPYSVYHTLQPESGYGAWSSTTCAAPLLQVDVVPADGVAWSSNTTLEQDTKTVFLEPLAFTTLYNASTQLINGQISGAYCTTSYHQSIYDCTDTIQLPYPGAINYSATGYYLHITPIYEDADLSVCASNGMPANTCNPNIDLYNAQALIDSTGKANNQLKRIQERVSINPVENNSDPAYALQSTNSICKQFTSRPGFSLGPGASSGC